MTLYMLYMHYFFFYIYFIYAFNSKYNTLSKIMRVIDFDDSLQMILESKFDLSLTRDIYFMHLHKG